MSDPFNRAEAFDEFEADLSQAENNTVPAGIFVARCSGVKKDVSKAGNPMFVWDFTIVADEHGKKCPASGMSPKSVYTALTPKALWKLEEILVALGVCKPGEKVKFTKADVLDAICQIVVEHTDFDGRPQAEISAFREYKGGIDQSALKGGDDIPF